MHNDYSEIGLVGGLTSQSQNTPHKSEGVAALILENTAWVSFSWGGGGGGGVGSARRLELGRLAQKLGSVGSHTGAGIWMIDHSTFENNGTPSTPSSNLKSRTMASVTAPCPPILRKKTVLGEPWYGDSELHLNIVTVMGTRITPSFPPSNPQPGTTQKTEKILAQRYPCENVESITKQR